MVFLIVLLYFVLGILVAKATIWLLTEGNPSSFVNDFDDEIDCIGTTFFLIVFFPAALAVMILLILGIVGYSFVIGFGSNNPLKEYIEAVKENLEKNKGK
jgi:uncharacterized membrane protein